MRELNILLFLIFSVALQAQVQNKHYFFQPISPEYGFTHDGIKTITEDKNGFLWFGSYDGIFQYNTTDIIKYKLLRHDSVFISYPRIVKVYRDTQDYLWICTYDGLFKYNSDLNYFTQIKLYKTDSTALYNNRIDNIIQIDLNKYIIIEKRTCYLYTAGDSILKIMYGDAKFDRHKINCIVKDKNTLLFGTDRGEIYISQNTYANPELFYKSDKGLVSSICRDGNKYYVGFITNGVDVVNLYGEKITEYNEKQTEENHKINNRVRQIIKRENGEIWIGSYKGLYIINNDKLTHLQYESNVGLPQSSIYELYLGINGGIWLGTWAGGIAYFHEANYQFVHVDPISPAGTKYQNSVTSFTEDELGNIWIGSERSGMSLYKTTFDEINKNKHPIYSSEYGINAVRTLLYLDNNKIIIGTFDQGLLLFDSKTEKIDYVFDKNDEKDLLSNNMTSAFNNHELWIAGFGLFKIDLRTKIVQNLSDSFRIVNKDYKDIRYLYFDSADNLWICTNSGLFVRYKNSNTFTHCSTLLKGESADASIYSCLEDVEGRIWLGTRGKGLLLYQPDIDSTSRIEMNDVINEADIYSLVKDKSDALWFSTNHGIFRYTNEYNAVDQFTEDDGLSGRQFNPNAAFLCSNGTLLFGSPNGFNVINPQIINQNIKRPRVFLSKLLINNMPYSKANTIACNSYTTGFLNTITLANQPNLNIEVISNNVIKSEKNRFKYRLLNYDDNWHEITKSKEISYTKIPAGDYVFEVFGSNNDKLWSIDPYRLNITVKKPVWARWYFMTLYFIVILLIISAIIKYNLVRTKLKKEVYQERYKNQANELISAERIKFFLNISHEIRTPLSLILSPIQILLAKFNYDDKTKELLTIVNRNAQRLVKLTDQTLDYRLLEKGKLTPRFEVTNIIELASNAYLFFQQQITEKQLNFSFKSEFVKLEVKVDADMIEKIIFNLLSNAINFTPDNGTIILSIEKKKLTNESYNNITCVGDHFIGESIELSITDSGKGIHPDSQYTIFERFTTGLNKKQSGTGIGLHLCKEYAILNNGNISLRSEEDKGSIFTLNLPLKYEGKTETNKNSNKLMLFHNSTRLSEDLELPIDSESSVSKKRNTILVVEPNNEFRHYLKTFLNNYFNTISAKTVELALDILVNVQPDLIISELKFTGQGGLEFIQKLKKQASTKNIPFIVLTAYSDSKYHLQSIVNGANSYFTKPIDDRLILAEINKLLLSKNEKDINDTSKSSLQLAISQAMGSEAFITIAERVVEKNFQNLDFNANTFADILNISQSTLFRKIKKETNLSCTEFIRDVKLKNAVHLLSTSSMNIDEIAIHVGFNSTSYFTRSFKKKFGKTPNEYRKSKK